MRRPTVGGRHRHERRTQEDDDTYLREAAAATHPHLYRCAVATPLATITRTG